MSYAGQATRSGARLGRLLGFLEADPGNLQLLGDAARAAHDEGELDRAAELLDRHAAIEPLPPALLNLKGVIALNQQRFEDAGDVFAALLADNPGDPALSFNLAWAKAMQADYEGALALLDEAVTGAVPRAAALKIQMLHHLARLDDALAIGPALAERHPNDPALMGALAIVALDAEQVDLARSYASRAGGAADGLSTLGMLELNDSRIDRSLPLFEQALKAQPDDARALLGKGLALLAKGDPAAAVGYIDRGAERFGRHLGSRVASGWAHFVKGDYAASRASFERALALDDTFAETHGGLAVLDIIAGDMDSARRRTEVALRLDPACFSAALAKSLILTSEGDTRSAERIRNIALNAPIGADGRTIAQAMVAMGMTPQQGPRRR